MKKKKAEEKQVTGKEKAVFGVYHKKRSTMHRVANASYDKLD
jgi:hypothetical protein